MPPLQECLEHADELAQEVVNVWAAHADAGNAAYLTDDFRALLEHSCQYQTVKRLADNHREFDLLSESDAAKETAMREAFCKAYLGFREKYASQLQ